MKGAFSGSSARSPDRYDRESERKRLLALLHIAKSDLKWSDEYYRSLLDGCFAVSTSAALSNDQLRAIVAAIRNRGWKPKSRSGDVDEQVLALRRRIENMALQLNTGRERVRGLSKSICGTESVNWCCDTAKLKRLLAVLGNIYRTERESGTA